jgi:hypothetical protein
LGFHDLEGEIMSTDKSHLKREARLDKNGVLNTKLVKEDQGGSKNAAKLASLGVAPSAQEPTPQVNSGNFSAADWAGVSTGEVEQVLQADLASDWWHKDPVSLLEKHVEAAEAGHRDVFNQNDPSTGQSYTRTVGLSVRDQWLNNGGYSMARREEYSKDPDYQRYRSTYEKYNKTFEASSMHWTPSDWAGASTDEVEQAVQADLKSDWWHRDPVSLLEHHIEAAKAGHADVLTKSNPDTGESYSNNVGIGVRDQWLKNGGYSTARRHEYVNDPDYKRYNATYAKFNTAFS